MNLPSTHQAANQPVTHPSDDRLRDFIAGRLQEAQTNAIGSHLEHCAACRERLEQLPDQDPLLLALRSCCRDDTDTQPDLRGQRIAQYELLEELGRGGMGVVYRAFDSRLKRDVALKLILAGEYADAAGRSRLRQEAAAISALQHPGVVQIHDVGEADGILYMALELLHPGGLAALTGARKRTPRWIAALIRQIALTLHHTHSAGIIHRDLKPENLLFAPGPDPEGLLSELHRSDETTPPLVKIADFGLCKLLDEAPRLTRTGMMLGTPDYMAPEQAPDSEGPIGPAADIFALGAILYELLAGVPPFHADSFARQLKRLRTEEAHAPSRLRPGIPRELEAICLKCLEKNPSHRYPTALALAEDLERFLNHQPVVARPPTPWRQLVLWARRKPIFASHLVAAVLLYLLHLIELLALKSAAHQGAAHFKLTLAILIWVSLAALCEAVRERRAHRRMGEYLYALLPPVMLHIEHWVDLNQSLTYINLFILVIPAAMLIRPRVGMLAVGTVATLLSFNLFAAIKRIGDPLILPMHHILFFNLVLLLLALANYLLIRRLAGET